MSLFTSIGQFFGFNPQSSPVTSSPLSLEKLENRQLLAANILDTLAFESSEISPCENLHVVQGVSQHDATYCKDSELGKPEGEGNFEGETPIEQGAFPLDFAIPLPNNLKITETGSEPQVTESSIGSPFDRPEPLVQIAYPNDYHARYDQFFFSAGPYSRSQALEPDTNNPLEPELEDGLNPKVKDLPDERGNTLKQDKQEHEDQLETSEDSQSAQASQTPEEQTAHPDSDRETNDSSAPKSQEPNSEVKKMPAQSDSNTVPQHRNSSFSEAVDQVFAEFESSSTSQDLRAYDFEADFVVRPLSDVGRTLQSAYTEAVDAVFGLAV